VDSKELNGTNNEAVSFSLTDENDFPVSLNGRNMVFTLLFYNRKSVKEVPSFTNEVPFSVKPVAISENKE